MRMKLSVIHRTGPDNSWEKEIEKAFGPVAHALKQVLHEESFEFDVADVDEFKARIDEWKADPPIDHLINEGEAEYYFQDEHWRDI